LLEIIGGCRLDAGALADDGTDVDSSDDRTFACECKCGRTADATRRAGNDCDLSTKAAIGRRVDYARGYPTV
jgi:hypothetical protein